MCSCNSVSLEDRVKYLIDEKKYDEAVHIIDSLSADAPANYDLSFLRGKIEFEKGNYKEAKNYFINYGSYNSLDPKCWQLLGECEKYLGELEQALKSFENAYSLERSKFLYLSILDLVLELEKDYLARAYTKEKELAHWESFLSSSDSFLVAKSLTRAERPERAIEYFSKMHLDRLGISELSAYALTLQMLGRNKDAIDISEYSILKFPNNSGFVNLKTHLFFLESFPVNEIVTNAKNSIKIDSSFSNYAYLQLAQAYALMNDDRCCEILENLSLHGITYSQELRTQCSSCD